MFSNTAIGIDLGTANLLIYTKNKGIVFNEPSVVAIDTHTGKVLAVGNEAKEMIGKTPHNIQSIRPLKDGVIADYEITSQMLSTMLKKVSKKLGRMSSFVHRQDLLLLNVVPSIMLFANMAPNKYTLLKNLSLLLLVLDYLLRSLFPIWLLILVEERAK